MTCWPLSNGQVDFLQLIAPRLNARSGTIAETAARI
jgi:hypothetical protein